MSEKQFVDQDALLDVKAKLRAAFASMRKKGFIARQSFSCCSGCAGAEITHDAEDLVRAGDAVRGCVFYHRQDAEVFSRPGARLFVRFGPLQSSKFGKIGEEGAIVGAEALSALLDAGLKASWSGDTSDCIEVDVWGGVEERKAKIEAARVEFNAAVQEARAVRDAAIEAAEKACDLVFEAERAKFRAAGGKC